MSLSDFRSGECVLVLTATIFPSEVDVVGDGVVGEESGRGNGFAYQQIHSYYMLSVLSPPLLQLPVLQLSFCHRQITKRQTAVEIVHHQVLFTHMSASFRSFTQPPTMCACLFVCLFVCVCVCVCSDGLFLAVLRDDVIEIR